MRNDMHTPHHFTKSLRFLSLMLFTLFFIPQAVRAQDAASTKNEAAPGESSRAYRSDVGGYSIVYPQNWEKSEKAFGPIDAIFFRKGEPGVNISITWSPIEKGEQLDESMVREMKEGIGKRYKEYKETAETWGTLDGVKAYSLSARFKQYGIELQNKQVMLIKAGRFYILTYSAVPKVFMKYLGEFEEAISTFKTVDSRLREEGKKSEAHAAGSSGGKE
jgi:hypothetical protein